MNRRARPVAHFKKFFSDKVFDLIVTQTNLYAEQQNINWQPVDKQEISAFLGILIIMGYHILPHTLGAYSREQGERFHQDLRVMEDRYQGRWDEHMMADYCWSITRECPENIHRRKSKKRSF